MKVLVTGAKGFVGKNLCAQLMNIKTGQAKCYGDLAITDVYEYDRDSEPEDLERYCADCDFVFNLAGVNRTDNEEEFMKGNHDFLSKLLDTLEAAGNNCPVMMSSSIQAAFSGRFGLNAYAVSKRTAEECLLEHRRRTGGEVMIYRFPNIFGKWCRPDYNSVVATFCHNIANGLPVQVNDSDAEIELLYIDDLVDEMINLLKCRSEVHQSPYRYCPLTYHTTVGELADTLQFYSDLPKPHLPHLPQFSLAAKLYATFLSYLPKERVTFKLDVRKDHRGSFAEFLKFIDGGQVSINVSKPGKVKGEHWHNSKWELFLVVSGYGLVRQRRIDSNEILDFAIEADQMKVVQILPGYTHELINLSDSQDLVTVIYCNEPYDSNRPDTFYLPIDTIGKNED